MEDQISSSPGKNIPKIIKSKANNAQKVIEFSGDHLDLQMVGNMTRENLRTNTDVVSDDENDEPMGNIHSVKSPNRGKVARIKTGKIHQRKSNNVLSIDMNNLDE